MTKLRRQRKRKSFRHDVNRKRMKKKMKRKPRVHCDQLESRWDKKKSTKVNLVEMGLMYDPNEHIKIPSNKPVWMTTDETPEPDQSKAAEVVAELEADATAPRERLFKLPATQVHWITKALDKYGEDYEAWAKDRKLNMFQDTPNQLRAKVKVFKSVPEQYEAYLKGKQESGETSTS